MPYTKSRIRADISSDGIKLGTADDWSGGELTSNATTYRQAKAVTILGGNPTRNDGKSTYLFTVAFAALYAQLKGCVGRGDITFTITLNMVGDDDTTVAGSPVDVLTGILKTLPPPPGDPKSDDPLEIDLEWTLNVASAKP